MIIIYVYVVKRKLAMQTMAIHRKPSTTAANHKHKWKTFLSILLSALAKHPTTTARREREKNAKWNKEHSWKPFLFELFRWFIAIWSTYIRKCHPNDLVELRLAIVPDVQAVHHLHIRAYSLILWRRYCVVHGHWSEWMIKTFQRNEEARMEMKGIFRLAESSLMENWNISSASSCVILAATNNWHSGHEQTLRQPAYVG